MLNPTEHEIQLLIKTIMLKNKYLAFKHSDVVFIMLINIKMPTIVGILTFMGMMNFILSKVEHEKSFIKYRAAFTIKYMGQHTRCQYLSSMLKCLY